MPGKFIVIDGIDGSGKQTQTELLREYLVNHGLNVLTLSFPRYKETFFGRLLRGALDGKYGDFLHLDPNLACIPYAADRWESKPLIDRHLSEGGIVLCDRYASSNQIHQGGKIPDDHERFAFLDTLKILEYEVFSIAKPDISIFLDVPPEVSERLMSDRTKDQVEENPSYIRDSYSAAQWLISLEPGQWIRVNCMLGRELRSREEIHREVVTTLKSRGVL